MKLLFNTILLIGSVLSCLTACSNDYITTEAEREKYIEQLNERHIQRLRALLAEGDLEGMKQQQVDMACECASLTDTTAVERFALETYRQIKEQGHKDVDAVSDGIGETQAFALRRDCMILEKAGFMIYATAALDQGMTMGKMIRDVEQMKLESCPNYTRWEYDLIEQTADLADETAGLDYRGSVTDAKTTGDLFYFFSNHWYTDVKDYVNQASGGAFQKETPGGEEMALAVAKDRYKVIAMLPEYNPDPPEGQELLEEIVSIYCDCASRYDLRSLFNYYTIKQDEAVKRGGVDQAHLAANPTAAEYLTHFYLVTCMKIPLQTYPGIEDRFSEDELMEVINRNCKNENSIHYQLVVEMDDLDRRKLPVRIAGDAGNEALSRIDREARDAVGLD